MTTQMIIRIEEDMKNKIQKIARIEGKGTSQVVRELIENYINERDAQSYIDDLWERIGKKIKTEGMTQNKIKNIIMKARNERNKSCN
ncbi:CopG family transcriptional regulator [Candidatus Poribacteria bacterium]|nr:CopG family transcriptional regulator [Candidatus Poribacteria bacterium]